MKWLKYFSLSLIILLLLALTLTGLYYYKGFSKTITKNQVRSNNLEKKELGEVRKKAAEIKQFEKEKGFNKQYVFLVDMKVPSGKNRFFVYDLLKDSIVKMGLVAHGAGRKMFSLSPIFSNTKESGCTALGKYKIGTPYKGRFGKAYKLYGLDSSNSNSFARNIVLHAYTCVPDKETYPYPICNSLGCPMVSHLFLSKLQPLIDSSTKPILMWIYQ
ncbi:MAG: murein L,D-transpeptidase catalytic domain family protein [Bacteroidetes bacterium]|nr:murein L,D-transpeptidase catalytic domain family protein [Bacteroidota bacterium]